jgi:predicted lipase
MVQVHGGFLDAYDSVRHRLLTLVEALLGTLRDDAGNEISSWHVYLTGHSLGGALATLFAVELSSKLAKSGGQTQITMYNFGSPRVGNKQFADMYNEVGEIFLDFFPVLYHLNYTTFLKH